MLDPQDVKKAARLARLEMTDSELMGVQEKLQTVLNFFQSLQEVSVEGIPPFFHGVQKMELREDRVEPSLPNEEVLRNAPESLDGCFKLPRIVGGGV